ncbi:MAG TPA: hypothetical protein VNL70_07495 [Tepidisphaeraceae bacterium]|nr:hypothetical protein [Tepidisphaeraceae bacterium]
MTARAYEIREAFSYLWKVPLAVLALLTLAAIAFVVLPAYLAALVTLTLAIGIGAACILGPAVVFQFLISLLLVLVGAVVLLLGSVAVAPAIAFALLCVACTAVLRRTVATGARIAAILRRQAAAAAAHLAEAGGTVASDLSRLPSRVRSMAGQLHRSAEQSRHLLVQAMRRWAAMVRRGGRSGVVGQ